ncbi:MAG: sugar transferase [Stagnimonas sp.]|nr:sugar transferase [Stagnimonas sp.]
MKTLDAKKVWASIAADISVKPYKGKRAFDIAAALAMCAVFAPLAICAGTLVCRQSGRPVLFRHRRVGQGGRAFDVYKFRSMVKDAEARLEALLATDAVVAKEWAETHKIKHDPRVTAVGRFLRKTSLDELPQIINVLKGEMSLVGPRPVVEQELEKYGASLPYYLSVKPGLTGLWQISGRSDLAYSKRVALDVEYARTQSFWKDVAIVLKTAKVLFKDRSAY